MIVQSIRERLAAELEGTFAIVEGAIELASLKGRPTALPAAYVITAREASDDNALMGSVRQLVQADILVVIVTDNLSDPRGQAAGDDIEGLKAKVRRALIGWEPDGAEDVITHVSGLLSAARDNVVWWEETFATSYFLEG